MNIKTIETLEGTYKTGRFQSGSQTWYGFIRKGETQMLFITREKFELGIKLITPPPLDPLPF